MVVFLDTGFLLAVKNRDDKNFEIAQSWMKRFLKNEFGEVITSTLVFNELVTLALVRIKRPDFAINLGNYILKSRKIKLISLTDDDFKNSWETFQKYKEKKLSFTDCAILTHCTRFNCNFLATFDNHFKGLIASNLS
ncbi:MAG: type II toxin-antitoxin system VapC family toxin [Candidatus Thorarchaeota archaeon]